MGGLGRVLGWVFVVAGAPTVLALPFPGGHRGQKPEPRPGYLGVVLGEVTLAEAAGMRLGDFAAMKRGAHLVVVLSVDRDAPAAAAGLRPEDVVLEIGTKRVDSPADVRHELKRLNAGETVLIRLRRSGVDQTVAVCLGDEEEIARRADQQLGTAAAAALAPAPAPVAVGGGGGGPHQFAFMGAFSPSATYTGVDLDPLTGQLAEFFGVHDGAGLLVRTVSDGSPGAVAGLHAGDVILRVNNEPVVSRMDWLKQVHANRGRAVELLVMRNHREQTLSMTPGLGNKG